MFRTIGIVGGLSPESTIIYYQRIVRRCHEFFGDHTYPEIVIYSVNFQRFIDWMSREKWDKITEQLVKDVKRLTKAGADFALIATNTMHLVYQEVQRRSPIPIVSIVEATAEAVNKDGVGKVGLLGTRFTMEKGFFKKGLADYGIDTLVPEKGNREYIDKVIFDELCRGVIRAASRERFLRIIGNIISQGAEGIVLGCTEIPLLIKPEHTSAKLFDTAIIHADKAFKLALESPVESKTD
jgi:aspartate racemase